MDKEKREGRSVFSGNKYDCFTLSFLRQDKKNQTIKLSILNFFQREGDLGEVYAMSEV